MFTVLHETVCGERRAYTSLELTTRGCGVYQMNTTLLKVTSNCIFNCPVLSKAWASCQLVSDFSAVFLLLRSGWISACKIYFDSCSKTAWAMYHLILPRYILYTIKNWILGFFRWNYHINPQLLIKKSLKNHLAVLFVTNHQECIFVVPELERTTKSRTFQLLGNWRLFWDVYQDNQINTAAWVVTGPWNAGELYATP